MKEFFNKSKNKCSICFVALSSYNIVSGREDLNHTGGAEVQQLLIAEWLVRKGYRVSFITLDHGQPDGIEFGGIKVFKAYRKENGISGLRFIHPRWSGLWGAMARSDADVYYQRTSDCQTGQVALWCCMYHRKFIFAAASNSDCDPSKSISKSWRDKYLYRLGLKLADAVTVQTTVQKQLLKQNMKRNGFLVPNCGPYSGNGSSCMQISTNTPKVLWIGRISEVKRFEWLLDIAEHSPEIRFEVIGASGKKSIYSSTLLKRASGIRNVKMHGFVPYPNIKKYYKNCSLLCCTSIYEGFPNTFLEAWAIGMPVVSTFDPDNVILLNGLGWIAQNKEGLSTCIKEVSRTPEIWQKASIAARKYYLANHIPEVCMPKFENVLLEVMENRTVKK